MKIAYIILVHKLPEQLVRLVRKLNTETVTFFIHIDKKTPVEIHKKITEPLASFKNVHFLKRYVRYYGDYNHVRATVEGIRKLIQLGVEYDYVILLTGQDYPIKSNQTIERFLQDSGHKSFMEYFPLPDDRWKDENGGLDRINYWHLHWRGWELALLKKNRFIKPIPDRIWSYLTKILPFQRRLPANFKWYGGNAYWCISRTCIEYIDEFMSKNPKVVKFFEHVKIPEEIFFQTILLNSPLKHKVVNNSLRYIIWSDSRHPATLEEQDFDLLIGTNNLFARKFDMTVDASLLDRIDQATL